MRYAPPLGRVIAVALLVTGLLCATAAHGAVSKVYWTDRNNGTLSVTDVASGNTQLLVAGFSRLQDVDLDTTTNVLYFADWGPVGFPGGQGSIHRVNPDGSGLGLVFATGDAVHQLALDPLLQRIYFTRAVSYDNHEISHVTTAGAGYTILLAGGFGGPGWFPSGLAVDPANGLLYWGDIGVIFNPPNGSVNRMTTAGGAPTQLTPHVTGRGRGFALDTASQTIFLTAHDPLSPGTGGGLFSYDIANGVETQLINDPGTGYWDIEIDPVSQRIWWTDYGRGEVRSARFDGTDVRVEIAGLTNPYGLALEIELVIVIDIKPGSDPNGLNPRSRGNVPVAILTTSVADGDAVDFDAWDVDPSTLAFGPNGAGIVHGQGHAEDVDGDGDLDMVVHFDIQETGIACGDTEATLTGQTFGGQPFTGTDAVKTTGC